MKSYSIKYDDKKITYYNQSCKDWTYPYLYKGAGYETLSSSGCGIFSLCHAVEWMTGESPHPEGLADFSMRFGGRGDDGTDRPVLLQSAMDTGLAKRYGFSYRGDGLVNDNNALFDHLYQGCGTALCNLRGGHIVTLLKARIYKGEKQFLVIDSVAESTNEHVREHVREIVDQSLIQHPIRNTTGLIVGVSYQYAMFYVTADLPRDHSILFHL